MQQRGGNKIRILIKKKRSNPGKQDREHHTAKKDVSGSIFYRSMQALQRQSGKWQSGFRMRSGKTAGSGSEKEEIDADSFRTDCLG